MFIHSLVTCITVPKKIKLLGFQYTCLNMYFCIFFFRLLKSLLNKCSAVVLQKLKRARQNAQHSQNKLDGLLITILKLEKIRREVNHIKILLLSILKLICYLRSARRVRQMITPPMHLIPPKL